MPGGQATMELCTEHRPEMLGAVRIVQGRIADDQPPSLDQRYQDFCRAGRVASDSRLNIRLLMLGERVEHRYRAGRVLSDCVLHLQQSASGCDCLQNGGGAGARWSPILRLHGSADLGRATTGHALDHCLCLAVGHHPVRHHLLSVERTFDPGQVQIMQEGRAMG